MIANAIARMQLGRKRSILQANESLSVATPAPVVPPLPACSDEPQSVATTAPELPSLPACSDQTLLDSPTIALHVDDNMQSSADPDFTEVFVPVKKKRRKVRIITELLHNKRYLCSLRTCECFANPMLSISMNYMSLRQVT